MMVIADMIVEKRLWRVQNLRFFLVHLGRLKATTQKQGKRWLRLNTIANLRNSSFKDLLQNARGLG